MLANNTRSSAYAIYLRLLRYIKPYWLHFLLGILATVFLAISDASIVGLFRPLLDKGFIARDTVFIRWLPIIVIFLFTVRSLMGFGSNYYLASVSRTLVMQIRQQVFNHFLSLPAAFYDRSTSGQLLSIIIYNVEQIANASTDALITLVQETFLIAGLVIVMVSASWQLSLLFIVTLPFIICIARYTSQRMRKLSRNTQDFMGEITHVAEEAIEGYPIIRTFGGETYERERFNQVTEKNRAYEIKLVVTKSLLSSSVQWVSGTVVVSILYLAVSHWTQITAGSFTAMIGAMLAMLKPMRSLATVNATIQKGVAAAESVFNLLDLASEKTQVSKKQLRLKRAKGAIVYQGVNFSYENKQPVLHDINFEIHPGETVALVGRSGSGKSTLVNLLPRFYTGYTGKIWIDGIDICQISLGDLRNQFALVSQNVILFNDTIARNIAYGRLNRATEKEIIQAAEMAHAMEFIENLPKGLNTLIGEKGVLLSGGQRQRVAIARALLKNAPLLILDEATSALDTEAEQYIQTAFQELMHHRTTLVIAHRLSTIEKADKILVLDKGRIIEADTHEQLLRQNAYYANLYRTQFKL